MQIFVVRKISIETFSVFSSIYRFKNRHWSKVNKGGIIVKLGVQTMSRSTPEDFKVY